MIHGLNGSFLNWTQFNNNGIKIYNWSNSENKIIKSESTFNVEKLEDKKIKEKTDSKSSWIKFFGK